MVFERKVLRKIFGPTKERDSKWRIKKKKDELDEFNFCVSMHHYIWVY